MKIKQLLLLVLLCFTYKLAFSNTAPWIGLDLKGKGCIYLPQGVGPFDYTTLTKEDSAPGHRLGIVENAHFTAEVENLISGKTSGANPSGDLHYTLNAWPNHHRALLSVIRFQLNINNNLTPHKLSTPPECYLQRAINFSPADAITYSLYGYYLHKIGQQEKAAIYYKKALTLDPDNTKFAYSFSLVLIDLKRYKDAVKYAKIAYQNPKTPTGLKQKLEKSGFWYE